MSIEPEKSKEALFPADVFEEGSTNSCTESIVMWKIGVL
jgi:hypothetical protein